jgi:hypothetical protein
MTATKQSGFGRGMVFKPSFAPTASKAAVEAAGKIRCHERKEERQGGL